MKSISLLPATLLLASCASAGPLTQGAEGLTLASPGGNLKVVVASDASGRLTYAVSEGGTPVLAPSSLGLTVDGVDLGTEAQVGAASTVPVAEDYPVLGHHAMAHGRANQVSIPVVSHGKAWTLQIRAEDDGVAVRYVLPEGSRHLDAESTAWRINGAGKAVWEDFVTCYEGVEHATDFAKIPEGRRVSGLMTVEAAGGHHLFLSEANNTNYPDFAFTRQGDAVKPVWYTSGKGFTLDKTRLTTPWRATVVAKDLSALVNSDLITNLCPPPEQGLDFSFVKPGRILWQWGSVGAPKLADQKAWYDAAAKLGWEYYMIDDGWRNWRAAGKDQWALLKETIAYGKTKGVETIIWVDSKEFIKSPQARKAYLEKVVACGAAGVKIDFIPDGNEQVMAWYEEVLRDTAQLKLMIIFHGCTKPTGRVRSWPHALTREGVRGNEWQMTRYHRKAPLDLDTLQPFGRFLAGAGDITPMLADPAQLNGFTRSHEFAQAITTLSPLACFYDHWKFYVGGPVEDLLREIPVVWDETRVLPGTEPGQVVAIARRKGNTWWLGVVNGAKETELALPLDFLGGDAKATLLFDAADPAAFDRREEPRKPGDVLKLKLRPGGGFVGRFVR